MNVMKLRPFIPSGSDYALAQRFFTELGFENTYADDGVTIFRMGTQEFFLQNFHNPDFQNNYMIELVVEDLDGWWSHLQAVTASNRYPVKVKEPTVYPWGKREIHLIDPAGVCWHLSEAKQ